MKINCLNPSHKDATPSMHVYPDMCYCFVCGFTCKSEDVINEEELKKIKPKEKENIKEKILYIQSLPVSHVRGLQLHIEQDGSYYVVWPDQSFYKKRVKTEMGSRYVGPRGHRPPLFRCKQEGSSKEILVITEGELNTLSLELSLCEPRIAMVSPGSANELMTHTDYYLQFNRIIVVVDKDIPGVYNGDKLKKTLLERGKSVDLIALQTDFNDLLQQGGPELVKHTFMKELGL